MNCPVCGAPLPPDASFCPNCGHNLSHQPTSVGVPGQHTDQRTGRSGSNGPRPPFEQDEVPTQQTFASTNADDRRDDRSASRPHRMSAGAKVAIAACTLLLVFAAMGAVAVCAGIVSGIHTRTAQSTHPVTFMVSIKDYDEGSSRIPVRITGTDINGESVDRTIFLAHSGVDVELLKGRYHAEVLGSPISSQGMIYAVPNTTIDFTLGEDLDPHEGYKMPSSLTLVFVPIDAQNMTDEQINDALTWARKDEESGVDVGKLEAAAKERQQTGIERSTEAPPESVEQQEETPAPVETQPEEAPDAQQPSEDQQPLDEQPQDDSEPSAE